MAEGEVCMEHSGCKAEIAQLKKDRDEDRQEIFPRLRSLERTVWQATGIVGLASFIGQIVIQHYWK